MLSLRRQTLWIQDWLRGARSVNVPPPEPIGPDGTVIANIRNVTSEDADNFVVVTVDDCKTLTDSESQELSYIDSYSIWYCPCCHDDRTDDDHEFVSRKSARLLELSGRREHDHSFCDLRSASKASKREKTTRQKYYNFRHVKIGDLGAHHSVGDSDADHEMPPETSQTGMAKTDLYRQAQLPPRPPKYHRRHIDKIQGTLSHRVDIRRENRKHGKAIMRDHLEDFDDGESVYRLILDLQASLALE
jgi:hypothetical protein